MENNGITPVMDMGGGNGWNGLWFLAIFMIAFGGFGGNRFGYGAERCATVEDINNSANFTRLESQVRANADLTERKADGIAAAVQTGFTNIGNGICNLGYEMAQQFGRTNLTVATGFSGIDKSIMESRYLTEKSVTDATDKISVQIAALSQKIDQNKIEALQAQVNQLQLKDALCGVVRYPVYATNNSPFCAANNCGCGCGI